MPILVKPYLGCNMHCKYCYQHDIKERTKYNIDDIIKSMNEAHSITKSQITIHGGEILCIGYKDLERLLSHSVELTKGSSIQTNGTLIDAKFIEIFKKYNTHVGISLDGDGELNNLRCDAPTTNKILKNLHRLLENKIPTSIIITVHNHNAGNDEQLEKLKSFILTMTGLGVVGRLNINHSEFSLSEERGKEVYLSLAKFVLENKLAKKWAPFTDIVASLKHAGNCVCTFRDCDIYHTEAADVILGDGYRTNCLRTKIMLRHPQLLTTRTEILENVEQMYGGCKGCKYFTYCKGGCSGNAPDWRMRDKYCGIYYTLFEYFSNMLDQLGVTIESTQPTCSAIMANDYKHTDGVEHLDGIVSHLDSDNPGNTRDCNINNESNKSPSYNPNSGGHSDGIEHQDGGTRHLDSNYNTTGKSNTSSNKQYNPNSCGHSDGIEHQDGGTRHLDSNGV